MNRALRSPSGFSIVELLIVIVVIGILATLTVVGYNGVTGRAAEVALKSDIQNAQAELTRINLRTGVYPDNLDGIAKSEGTLLEYTKGLNGYCISASSDAAPSSFYFNSSSNTLEVGLCPGHTAGGPPVAIAVANGQHHTCAIASGRVYCWGGNTFGQLGQFNNRFISSCSCCGRWSLGRKDGDRYYCG